MSKKRVTNVDHWLYSIIPREEPGTSENEKGSRLMWSLFGNDDDGIFGEEPTSGNEWIDKYKMHTDSEGVWQPGEITFIRFVKWQLRNPLHNLFFYVWGSADKEYHTTEEVLHWGEPNPRDSVLPFVNNGLYIAKHDGKYFLSFRAFGLEGYIGAREKGNWGAALRRASNK